MIRTEALQENWKLVDEFDTAYWSGLDAHIYINDIFLDEALQLNYQILEQLRPYYNYASYVPNRIYHGARLISGELSLNFKREGFIFSLLSNIGKGLQTSFSTYASQNDVAPYSLDLSTISTDSSGAISQAEIKALKAKKSANQFNTYSSVDDATVYNTRGMFENPGQELEIKVVFGTPLSNGRKIVWQSETNYYLDNNVDEDPTGFKDGITTANGIKLIGVHFQSRGTSITDDGRAIAETYSFMARNIQILKVSDITGNTANPNTVNLNNFAKTFTPF